MASVVLIKGTDVTFMTRLDLEHMRYALRKYERKHAEEAGVIKTVRRATFKPVGDGGYRTNLGRLKSLVGTLAWYGPVTITKESTFQQTCRGSCSSAASAVAYCVCACGGVHHGAGFDADVILDGGGLVSHVPVVMEWRVPKGGHFDPDKPDSVKNA